MAQDNQRFSPTRRPLPLRSLSGSSCGSTASDSLLRTNRTNAPQHRSFDPAGKRRGTHHRPPRQPTTSPAASPANRKRRRSVLAPAPLPGFARPGSHHPRVRCLLAIVESAEKKPARRLAFGRRRIRAAPSLSLGKTAWGPLSCERSRGFPVAHSMA